MGLMQWKQTFLVDMRGSCLLKGEISCNLPEVNQVKLGSGEVENKTCFTKFCNKLGKFRFSSWLLISGVIYRTTADKKVDSKNSTASITKPEEQNILYKCVCCSLTIQIGTIFLGNKGGKIEAIYSLLQFT